MPRKSLKRSKTNSIKPHGLRVKCTVVWSVGCFPRKTSITTKLPLYSRRVGLGEVGLKNVHLTLLYGFPSLAVRP